MKRVLLLFLPFITQAQASEYIFQEPHIGKRSYKEVLNHLHAPDIRLNSSCSGSPITICKYYATNQDNRLIRSFASGMSAEAKARYGNKAYVVMQSSACNMLGCNTYHLLQNNGRMTTFKQDHVVAPFASVEGNLHVMTRDQYLVRTPAGRTIQSITAPEPIEDGIYGTSLSGDIAAIAVGKSGLLYLYDGKALRNLGLQLSAHGDRDNIISVYPDKGYIYVAAYLYTNAYNKGLYILSYDRHTERTTGGWLLNSEERNIGFDVSIYKQGKEIFLGSRDSSRNRDVHFTLSDETIARLSPELPEHLQASGFEDEPYVSMMAGMTLARVNISLKSTAPYDNPAFKTAISLDVDDTWLKGANFEGRIGDIPLTLQYLQSKAVDTTVEATSPTTTGSRRISQAASHKFFASFDLDNILSTSTLRLQLSEAAISGIAHITDAAGSRNSHAFSSHLLRSALHFLIEGGGYWGIEYKTVSSPAKVGFSDYRQQTVYTGVDLKAEFKTLKGVLGYDRMAYAKRYETDFSDFYWSGNINAGLGSVKFSDAFEQEVQLNNPYSSMQPDHIYGEAGFDAELGYIWQQRFKQWKGFGYSVGAGYLLSGSYLQGSRPDDKSTLEYGKLYKNIAYSQFAHGPYLRFNIMF